MELIGANRILFYARNRHLIAEDTLMRTAGVGDKNRDDEGAAARSWIPDPGYSILDTRCRILEARYWFLVPGPWSLVSGGL